MRQLKIWDIMEHLRYLGNTGFMEFMVQLEDYSTTWTQFYTIRTIKCSPKLSRCSFPGELWSGHLQSTCSHHRRPCEYWRLLCFPGHQTTRQHHVLSRLVVRELQHTLN